MFLQRKKLKLVFSLRIFRIIFGHPVSHPLTSVSIHHIRVLCVIDAMEVLSKS